MDAATRVRKMRTALLLQQPFFGTLAAGLALKIVDAPEITAATDGLSIFINPRWVDQCDDRELKCTITEMVMHTALRHPVRRGFRDEGIWNRACDQAVFDAMVRARMPLRKSVKPDPQYRGLTAEQIYRLMLPIKADGPQPPETPPPPPSPGGQGMGQEESSEKTETTQVEPSPPDDAIEPDEANTDAEQGAPQPAESSDQPDNDQQQKGSGDKPADAGGGAGSKEADGGDPSARSAAQGKTGDTSNGEATRSAGNAAGHEPGEVLDPPSGTDPSIAEAQIVRSIRRAVKGAKHFGNLPVELEMEVKELLRQRQDWRSHLAAWMQQIAREDYSWTRPNKRYLASGIYLPSLHVEALGPIVYAIDTSGSITQQELDEAADEATAVCDQVSPERVHVVYCDTQVQGVDVFERDDLLRFARKGGGGTAFQPVFDWVEKQDEPPVGVVYFTDGLGPFPEKQPEYPVLWLVKGPVVPPWGEHVRLD